MLSCYLGLKRARGHAVNKYSYHVFSHNFFHQLPCVCLCVFAFPGRQLSVVHFELGEEQVKKLLSQVEDIERAIAAHTAS